MSNDKVVHLDERRTKPADDQTLSDWQETAAYMLKQNLELMAKVDSQSNKIDVQSGAINKLLRSVEILANEMHDYRTGKKDAAFARIARHDEEGENLLTAKADVSVQYPHSSGEIGNQLGMTGSRVGRLLGRHGLKWADNPDYQETTLWKQGRIRFWHKDILVKLTEVIEKKQPNDFGIVAKDVISTFMKLKLAGKQANLPS